MCRRGVSWGECSRREQRGVSWGEWEQRGVCMLCRGVYVEGCSEECAKIVHVQKGGVQMKGVCCVEESVHVVHVYRECVC